MKKLIITFINILALNVNATQIPVSHPNDSRIKRVAYSEHNVVPIYGTPFVSTQVLFGADEHVLDVEGGDTEGWMVTFHKNVPNMIFIKPTTLNNRSNITVVTNKHSYYFSVASHKIIKSRKDQQTYTLKFVYPEDERKRLKAALNKKQLTKQSTINSNKHPAQYNWNYAFNGSKAVMPAHIFDDGVFTYFELRPQQDVPAIFAIDNKKGEEALVNVSRQGNYLIVHRLAPQFTLRSGKNHVASIFNNKTICNIRKGLA